METISLCPVCGNDQLSPFLICKDYLVSRKDFAIQQCKTCGFRLTNPRPDETEIGSYYKSDQYISHNDEGGGLINIAYRAVRTYTLKSKLSLINKLNEGTGRVLDIGCGTGTFLETCQLGGWQVIGMEPDDDARKIASAKLQSDIRPNMTALTNMDSADIITLWHVLEHIPNLNQTISQFDKLLSKKGNLVIAVPNSDSYDASYFKEYWAAYDVPRHLHHFTPSTIVPLLAKHGFQLLEQQPMLFDSLYIAMLSTRYRSGKTNYLESVQVGLTSNIKSRKTGNSSSQIYIFRKAR